MAFRPFFYTTNSTHILNTPFTTCTSATCPETNKSTEELLGIELGNYRGRIMRKHTRQAASQDPQRVDKGGKDTNPFAFDRLFSERELHKTVCQTIQDFESIEERERYNKAIEYFDAHPCYWQYFVHLVQGRLFLRTCYGVGHCITLHDCNHYMSGVLADASAHPESSSHRQLLALFSNTKPFAMGKKLAASSHIRSAICTTPQQLCFFHEFFRCGYFEPFLSYLYSYATHEHLGKKPSLV